MKYSFTTFSTPDLDLQQTLQVAKKYGYQGIEPRICAKHKHGIEFDASSEQRKTIKDLAKKEQIQICSLATSCRFSDPSLTGAMEKEAVQSIDLASDIDCSVIRVFGGKIPKGTSYNKAREYIIGSLKAISAHAAQKNVKVCLETHDDWCQADAVAGIVSEINHPNIRVNWDIWHTVRKGTSVEDSWALLKSWTSHVHIHDGLLDEPLVFKPMGQGKIDHKKALEVLSESGYQGFLSGEWIEFGPWEEHLPREIAQLRAYEKELQVTAA